jgi:hypothetical protein
LLWLLFMEWSLQAGRAAALNPRVVCGDRDDAS